MISNSCGGSVCGPSDDDGWFPILPSRPDQWAECGVWWCSELRQPARASVTAAAAARPGAASLGPTNPRPRPRRDPSTCPPAHAKPSAERTAAPCGSAAFSPQSHPSDFGETIPITIEIGQGCDLPTSAMIAERTYLSPFTKDNRARMVIRRLNIFCAISMAIQPPITHALPNVFCNVCCSLLSVPPSPSTGSIL